MPQTCVICNKELDDDEAYEEHKKHFYELAKKCINNDEELENVGYSLASFVLKHYFFHNFHLLPSDKQCSMKY